MKEKKTMMKKPGALRLSALMGAGAVLGVAAALILSCSPLFEAPAGGSGETGRVVLSVSTGGAAPARTVLPTEVPNFSRYELVFRRRNRYGSQHRRYCRRGGKTEACRRGLDGRGYRLPDIYGFRRNGTRIRGRAGREPDNGCPREKLGR